MAFASGELSGGGSTALSCSAQYVGWRWPAGLQLVVSNPTCGSPRLTFCSSMGIFQHEARPATGVGRISIFACLLREFQTMCVPATGSSTLESENPFVSWVVASRIRPCESTADNWSSCCCVLVEPSARVWTVVLLNSSVYGWVITRGGFLLVLASCPMHDAPIRVSARPVEIIKTESLHNVLAIGSSVSTPTFLRAPIMIALTGRGKQNGEPQRVLRR